MIHKMVLILKKNHCPLLNAEIPRRFTMSLFLGGDSVVMHSLLFVVAPTFFLIYTRKQKKLIFDC